MAIRSMTAFARIDGSLGNVNWHWEVRTVNGRGLDIRIRLPAGYEALERVGRKACAKIILRGNCNLTLSVKYSAGNQEIRLNEAVFKQVLTAAERACELSKAPRPAIDTLLSMRGVLEVGELAEDEEQKVSRHSQILDGLKCALEQILVMRLSEGGRLQNVIECLQLEA